MKTLIAVVGLLVAPLMDCTGFWGGSDTPRTRLMERIPNNRPSWVDREESTWEKKGQVYFVATALQGGDYALTVAQAEAEAAALIARRVGEELSHRLRSNVSGSNRIGEDVGRFIDRKVEEQTLTFRVSGVDVRARYCERIWESSTNGGGGRQYFNCWVQLAVPLSDIVAARQGLARKAAAAVGNPQDEAARLASEAFSAELGAAGTRE